MVTQEDVEVEVDTNLQVDAPEDQVQALVEEAHVIDQQEAQVYDNGPLEAVEDDQAEDQVVEARSEVVGVLDELDEIVEAAEQEAELQAHTEPQIEQVEAPVQAQMQVEPVAQVTAESQEVALVEEAKIGDSLVDKQLSNIAGPSNGVNIEEQQENSLKQS